VSIHTREQNAAVRAAANAAGIAGNIWIGARDSANEGTWVWQDGAVISGSSYVNWNPGEPNVRLSSGQDCMYMKSSGRWAASHCTCGGCNGFFHPSVCEGVIADPSEASAGRRLAETTLAAAGSAAPIATAKALDRALLNGSLRMARDGHGDDDGEAAVVTPPGARRLLKGGTSSFTSSGISSGGRSGSTGSSRWGGSSHAVTTTSYQGGGGASTATSTARVHLGNTYGGSSTGYYRHSYSGHSFFYYGGHRSYRYSYAPRVFGQGATFYAVHSYAYGCYTCANRTCYACSSCTTRKSCNAEARSSFDSDLDRYEVLLDETPFVTPAAAAWPLQLRIFNMTQFVQRAIANDAGAQPASSSSGLYLSFYTEGRDWEDITSEEWKYYFKWFFGCFGFLWICICTMAAIMYNKDAERRKTHAS